VTTRFVLFSRGRTGSKLLVQLLNSHPAVRCEGEVLNGFFWGAIGQRLLLPLCKRQPLPLLYYRAARSGAQAWGCKLFANQCSQPRQVVTGLARRDWRIVHLWRRDLLSQALSLEVARATGRWHRQLNRPEGATGVVLDPEAVRLSVAEMLVQHERYQQLLQGIPHREVIYEDHLADPLRRDHAMRELLAWLGLPDAPLTTTLATTWEQPYCELVTNYAEIEHHLQRHFPPQTLYLGPKR